MQLKVCGIKDLEIARHAVQRGVSYLGFIFWPKSVRAVSVHEADRIVEAVCGRVKTVGVFVDAGVDDMIDIAETLSLSVVQLHGSQEPRTAQCLIDAGFEVWKSVYTQIPNGYPADGYVIDAQRGTMPGGTGLRADWSLVDRVKRSGKQAILAGGIAVENLRSAYKTGCDVLDVNSSLECSPGRKSMTKMDAFFDAFDVL